MSSSSCTLALASAQSAKDAGVRLPKFFLHLSIATKTATLFITLTSFGTSLPFSNGSSLISELIRRRRLAHFFLIVIFSSNLSSVINSVVVTRLSEGSQASPDTRISGRNYFNFLRHSPPNPPSAKNRSMHHSRRKSVPKRSLACLSVAKPRQKVSFTFFDGLFLYGQSV